ncbi:MAG: ACP phosphodiesterase [Pseudomonadota bacterium]|nr:ACP phosphodiesterase [Pseudomonadota bacterium]
MNYLAHAHLAHYSDEAILGAILGDFVRGQSALADWPAVVRQEILRHRQIDSYTDSHPETMQLRNLFAKGERRYAGIVLDMYFDHCLARDWSRWSDKSLTQFCQRVYRILNTDLHRLPAPLAAQAPLMQAHDWLGNYQHLTGTARAIAGIARRLSRNGERLVACFHTLVQHQAEADAAFARFFPQLLHDFPMPSEHPNLAHESVTLDTRLAQCRY